MENLAFFYCVCEIENNHDQDTTFIKQSNLLAGWTLDLYFSKSCNIYLRPLISSLYGCETELLSSFRQSVRASIFWWVLMVNIK